MTLKGVESFQPQQGLTYVVIRRGMAKPLSQIRDQSNGCNINEILRQVKCAFLL